MKSGSARDKDRPLPVLEEKELFKKQYLKMRDNYENKIKELSVIKELVDKLRLTGIYERETLFSEQLDIIRKYFAMEHVSLILLNDESQKLEVAASLDDDGWLSDPNHRRLTHEAAEQALIRGNAILINNMHNAAVPEQKETVSGPSLLCTPLLHNNQAIGVLILICSALKSFDQNEVSFFSLVADQIVTSIILSRLYSQMLREENKRFLLSRFFSKNVTEEILAQDGIIQLGGNRKRATIFFADLRGFTSISEKLDEERVVEILNEFFSHITPIIFKNEGTLDKLLGDGILAIFGAPISHPDDPIRAIRTAVEMVLALRTFNELHRDRKWPELKIGIGINTGDVVAGYIGSKDHLNYTVIGDAVNIAQRIESIAKPDEILITKAVRDAIDGFPLEEQGVRALTELPAQNVKGKNESIQIFRVEY